MAGGWCLPDSGREAKTAVKRRIGDAAVKAGRHGH